MISRAGIARSFQNIEVFPEMTVFENVLVVRAFSGRVRFAPGDAADSGI